ncbi:MAG: acyltransferase, partial [Deltaproteobacteria bacterium]|nr:acyltransferase [Deltaproteobacteria bacterium]
TRGSAFGSFFYRRLLRIIPPYYLALVVMLATCAFPLHEAPWYFGFASNIRDSLHPVLEGPMVTMWSVAVEEQFYLLWPLLVLLAPRRALAPAFAAAIVGAVVFRLIVHANADAVYRLMFSRMDLLAAGGLLALFEEHLVRWRRAFAWMLSIAFSIFVLSTRLRGLAIEHVQYALVCVGLTALLALIRTCESGPVYALLTLPAIAYIGRISYTAYLVHDIAIERVHELGLPGAVAVALAFALTITFATLSWYLLEVPLARLRGRVRVVPAC